MEVLAADNIVSQPFAIKIFPFTACCASARHHLVQILTVFLVDSYDLSRKQQAVTSHTYCLLPKHLLP